ncbi:cell wall-binding repeat-containing protein, partial [Peptacetobacter sp.]|uniref:cell wall-binding repeat-containing protein n=1 Tax=Peptacetobacter sp. TaxID=2991975 RepID=UPI00261FE9A5
MNKKLLSTVMAGAMLATSVAPVFAEYEVYDAEKMKEYKISDKDKLTKLILEIMNDRFVPTGPESYTSIYGIRNSKNYGKNKGKNNPNGFIFYDPNASIYNKEPNKEYTEEEKFELRTKHIKDLINGAKVGETIELIDRGHMINDNRYYHYYATDMSKDISRKYIEYYLEEDYNTWKNDSLKEQNYPLIKNMEYSNKVLTITLKDDRKITLKEGDIDIEPTIGLDKDGNVTKDIDKFDHFETRILTSKKEPFNGLEIDQFIEHFNKDNNKDKYTYISNIEKGKFENYKVDITITLKDGYHHNNSKEIKIPMSSRMFPDFNKPIFDKNDDKNIIGFEDYLFGGLKFKGQYGDEVDGKIIAKFTITDDSNDTKVPNLNEVLPPKPNDLKPPTDNNHGCEPDNKPDNKPSIPDTNPVLPPVKPDNKPEKPNEIIAGEDRYETSVEVAEQIAPLDDIAENGSVVLVNGKAIVDGLAAAPLAATISKNGPVKAAPILLTKADKLPEPTRKYFERLAAKQNELHLGRIKVYIVGGTVVVSKNVEKELTDLGFEIIRANGKNREETSLLVSDIMAEKHKASNSFLVGGEGEADAMSISAIAASRREPIIVSKLGGLTKEAVDKIAAKKNYTTIVGGENVVSNEEEKELKDANINLTRVAGKDRLETNAKVIDKYASSRLSKIIISKDGKYNKLDLIDALPASSLAVKFDAPIVLATDKISDSQIKVLKDN